MFAISVKTQRNGFALFIEAPEGITYVIDFLAIGPGGRETTGSLRGVTTAGGTWTYQSIVFPVVRVGITDIRLLPHGYRDRPREAVEDVAQRQPPVFRSSADAAFMTTTAVQGPTAVPYVRPDYPTGEVAVPYGTHAIPYFADGYPIDEHYLRDVLYGDRYLSDIDYPMDDRYERDVPYPEPTRIPYE